MNKEQRSAMTISQYRQFERRKYYKRLQETVLIVSQKYFRPNQIQRDSRILRGISHIRFPYLKELNSFNNLIDNIQALQWLDAPQLQLLLLENNFIISLKPLIKILSSNLQFVNLKGNFTTHDQIQNIIRMENKHLFYFRFEYHPRILIVSTFFKIKSNKIKSNLLTQFQYNSKKLFINRNNQSTQNFVTKYTRSNILTTKFIDYQIYLLRIKV